MIAKRLITLCAFCKIDVKEMPVKSWDEFK